MRRKHSYTGTERSSAFDRIIEKIGGGAGGARKRLQIKTDLGQKIRQTKLRIETFKSLSREGQKKTITEKGKLAMFKARSKMSDLKYKARLSLPQRKTLRKLGNLASVGGGIVLAGATATGISKAVLVPSFKKQWEKNSQKRKERERKEREVKMLNKKYYTGKSILTK